MEVVRHARKYKLYDIHEVIGGWVHQHIVIIKPALFLHQNITHPEHVQEDAGHTGFWLYLIV